MMLVSVYLFMGYTVSRLTDSLRKFALLKAKDLKDEPCRFWLEDKVELPNLFQRHFNLILMIKDVYVCVLLLALYKQVPTMLFLLLIQQVIFFGFAVTYPPYGVGWNNKVMLITQGLYILLDIAFLVNVLTPMSAEDRYFYVGFSMIAIVLVIILVNMLIGMYYQSKETYLRCKKKREEAKVLANSQVAPAAIRLAAGPDAKSNALVVNPENKDDSLQAFEPKENDSSPLDPVRPVDSNEKPKTDGNSNQSEVAKLKRKKIYNNKKASILYHKDGPNPPKVSVQP